jgi:uncharacterized protein (TIGR00297 family)
MYFAIENITLSLIICSILGIVGYWKKVLDVKGSFSAFVIGMIVGVFGNVYWIFLLLIFMASSFIATKYKHDTKEARGVAEHKMSTRRAKNVLANGLVPAAVVLFGSFYFEKYISAILFITAISVAMSDTIASEIGMLSDRAYLITNPKKRVKPGTNGGISLLGEGAAVFAAIFITITGWIILSLSQTLPKNPSLMLFPLLIGLAGCHIDSVLGATLQEKGVLTNSGVNIVSITISTSIALLLICLWGC